MDPLEDESIEVREAEQLIWGRRWFTYLAFAWFGLGIAAFAIVLVTAIVFWWRGELKALPTGLQWLLGSFLGAETAGAFVIYRVLGYYFPGK